MGAALGLIGPLVGIGSSLFGLANGTPASNSNVPQAPPAYQYSGSAAADQGAQAGIGRLSSSTVPQAVSTTNNLINNPGAAGLISGAGAAGQLGQAAGINQFTQGGNLVSTGNSVVPYAYSALNAGFDPLNSVYNQQFQQNTDQTRALLEARGIDSTPYGAGVEAQSNLNFNNAWQQNLLQREQTGAATANSLFNTQAGDITTGTNLQGAGSNTYATASGLPYNAYNTIGTNQLAALGTSQGLQNLPIQDYLAYLSGGTSASGANAGITSANTGLANAQFNQNNVLGQNLGGALTALGKGWGNATASNGNFNTFNAPGYSFPMAA